MAAAQARPFKRTTVVGQYAAGKGLSRRPPSAAKSRGDLARGEVPPGPAAGMAAAGLLVLGLGALVLAEYALFWHLLFAPWVEAIAWLDAAPSGYR